MRKPILCLDFDGVIHSYTSRWLGADQIPDPPVPGALEFIAEAQKHFEVHIFSSRSNEPGGIEAMMNWLSDNSPDYWEGDMGTIVFPTVKPKAFLTIDDRAITFTGKFPDPKTLLDFKPWNR